MNPALVLFEHTSYVQDRIKGFWRSRPKKNSAPSLKFKEPSVGVIRSALTQNQILILLISVAVAGKTGQINVKINLIGSVLFLC